MSNISRAGFLQDISRCLDCSGCEIACKRHKDVPKDIFYRKVVTLNEGTEQEKHISLSCMHCSNPPCVAVCPVDAIWQREDGIVLVKEEKCIGCGYCLTACPFGAPQFPKEGIGRGVMKKCDFCVNRADEGKGPMCVANCATKSLLGGDRSEISETYRKRVSTKTEGQGTFSSP